MVGLTLRRFLRSKWLLDLPDLEIVLRGHFNRDFEKIEIIITIRYKIPTF